MAVPSSVTKATRPSQGVRVSTGVSTRSTSPASQPRSPISDRASLDHGAVLSVDRYEVGAGFGELADLAQHDVALHHEMEVQRLRGQGADPCHLVGEEEERGREAAVRDVDMVEVGVGLRAPDVAFEIGEVGGPERVFAEHALARQGGEPACRGLGLGRHASGSVATRR